MRKILSLLATTILSTTASASIIACGGGETSSIQKTDLSLLPGQFIIKDIPNHDFSSFIQQLSRQIISIPTFKNLDIKNDFFIYKKGTTDVLKSDDIVTNHNLEITITAKSTNQNFMGSKDIEVNLTVQKINLNVDELENNLRFTKTMTGQDAYNEFRSKIKDLSHGIYKNTSEIKNDNTILISIWTSQVDCLEDKISDQSLSNFNKIGVQISVTKDNRAFHQLDSWQINNINVF